MIFAPTSKLSKSSPDRGSRRPSVDTRLQLPSLNQMRFNFDGEKREKTAADTEEAATTFVTNLM